MVILLVTVMTISGLLTALLIYHAKRTRAKLDSRSSFHILFAIFIGVGFMILEVTFIQKFLLLLGTPIMALTVILFSILLSSGIGSYISGKMFSTRPHRAVLTSIPILAVIIIIYFLYLAGNSVYHQYGFAIQNCGYIWAIISGRIFDGISIPFSY